MILPHHNVAFDWLTKQALDDETASHLSNMQHARIEFLSNGTRNANTEEIILRLSNAILSTSMKTYYSTLYAYQEIFMHQEHFSSDHVDMTGYIFDIGANEGLFTIATCLRNPEATIICIEANPSTVKILKKNLALNNLTSRCRVIEAAIWSSETLQQLEFSPYVTTNSALSLSPAKSRWLSGNNSLSVNIQTRTLDSITTELQIEAIDLMKIDIEGSEFEALKGAGHTLAMTDQLVIEYHSSTLKSKLIDLLDTQDFSVERVTTDAISGTPDCGNIYSHKISILDKTL